MVTLKQRLKALAPGLAPRAVLEKLAAIQMIDVELPTTDGRTIVLSRHTEPEDDPRLLLQRLKLDLPPSRPQELWLPFKLDLRETSRPCSSDFQRPSPALSTIYRRKTRELVKSG